MRKLFSREMLFCRTCRRFSSTNLNKTLPEVTTSNRWKYKLDDNVDRDLQNEKYKPRHHPGIVPCNVVNVPNAFLKATKIILEEQEGVPKKEIIQRSENFVRYLRYKKPPMEQEELKAHIARLREKIVNSLEQTNKELLKDPHVIKSQLTNLMKKTVYNWYSVRYDIMQSLCYLVGRSAPEYAVLIKILSEIKFRDAEWKPKTLFDFGSGVGTVTWAANTIWPKSFMEYFNVDSSAEMNDLAELLLKGGRGEKKISLSGVYYRQFFPSKPTPYDLVVSAYTLMELPSLESRMQVIQQLWRKTTKYLVVVEQGSYVGYKLINEVRDFILGLGNSHVFAPCPHDNVCPQYMANNGIPCNFGVRYYGMPFLDNKQTIKVENFSYIILKKGERSKDEPQWPRLINPTLLRHKHVICNLCTSEGKMEQSVFTASKYGKFTYRCAKATDWGDRLPVNLKDNPQNNESIDDTTKCDEKINQ